MSEHCTHEGCNAPVVEVSGQGNALRLCQAHAEQWKERIDTCLKEPGEHNVGRLLSTWIRSHGGARKLADKMVGR